MIKLVCHYCSQEIMDWEEVFIIDDKPFHKDCFFYEYEITYYSRAEDAKVDMIAAMKGAERV